MATPKTPKTPSAKERQLAGLTNMGKGRPRGAKNKFTTLKQAFLNAFENIGGEDELARWAKRPLNKGEFYKLAAKMLPKEVEISGKNGGAINVRNAEEYTDAELAAMITAASDAENDGEGE